MLRHLPSHCRKQRGAATPITNVHPRSRIAPEHSAPEPRYHLTEEGLPPSCAVASVAGEGDVAESRGKESPPSLTVATSEEKEKAVRGSCWTPPSSIAYDILHRDLSKRKISIDVLKHLFNIIGISDQLAIVASHAVTLVAADAISYWKSELPNTAMPQAIKDSLSQTAGWVEEKGTSVGVGKGGVNVNTGKGKPGGGTRVNVGHGGVGVHAGAPGHRTNVGVGKAAFTWEPPANTPRLRRGPSDETNHHRMRRTSDQRRRETMRHFIGIHGRFLQIQAGEEGPGNIHRGRRPNIHAKIHHFWVQRFKTTTKLLSATSKTMHTLFSTATRHRPPRLTRFSLVGANGAKVKAAVVCHKDTSAWNPKHLAFQVLKIKPGTVPVCHFLPEDHIVWVAN
nr:BURP domain protein RD22-like [Ipomoea trifida]